MRSDLAGAIARLETVFTLMQLAAGEELSRTGIAIGTDMGLETGNSPILCRRRGPDTAACAAHDMGRRRRRRSPQE